MKIAAVIFAVAMAGCSLKVKGLPNFGGAGGAGDTASPVNAGAAASPASSSNGTSNGSESDTASQAAAAAGPGAPTVELWDDGMADVKMDARQIQVQLDPAKENGTCNGLDDDGDGQIDEACGLKSGGIQITATWEDGTNVDLIVRHDGQSIDHGKMAITGGTRLSGYTLKKQFDAQGSCACKRLRNSNGSFAGCQGGCTARGTECYADDSKQYVENIYLDRAKAPPGEYKVFFRADNGCGCRRADRKKRGTPVTVSVSVDGKVLGVYRSGALGSQSSEYPILTLKI